MPTFESAFFAHMHAVCMPLTGSVPQVKGSTRGGLQLLMLPANVDGRLGVGMGYLTPSKIGEG